MKLYQLPAHKLVQCFPYMAYTGRFSSPLTPSNDAQSVDHGCVAIGADHTVWVKQTLIVEHYTSQILQVHLKVKEKLHVRHW